MNNLGPQTTFPVPEGILDYNGINFGLSMKMARALVD